MTEPVGKSDVGRGRPSNEDDQRRVAATTEIEQDPNLDREQAEPPAVGTVLGFQAGMFFTVVLLTVIFLAAIIIFAVTR